MSTNVSVNHLWDLARSLSPDNKRWLADKLYEAAKEEWQEESLPLYTMEELEERINNAIGDIKSDRVLSSEEVHNQIKAYIASL